MRKSIHLYVRVHVVTSHDAALSQFQISKQLRVSRCCVQNTIKKYKQLGRFDDFKYTERPQKLSGLEIRHLKRLVKGILALVRAKLQWT